MFIHTIDSTGQRASSTRTVPRLVGTSTTQRTLDLEEGMDMDFVRTRVRNETVAQWLAGIVASNTGKDSTKWPVRAKVPSHLITEVGAPIVFVAADGTYKAKGAK